MQKKVRQVLTRMGIQVIGRQYDEPTFHDHEIRDHGTCDHEIRDHGTCDHEIRDHGTCDHEIRDHGTCDHESSNLSIRCHDSRIALE
jgi:hypothetical protein